MSEQFHIFAFHALSDDAKRTGRIEEAIALCHQDGKPLPPPTSGRDYANKMQNFA